MTDTCVCCGEIIPEEIPEGRMVCPICEAEAAENEGVILFQQRATTTRRLWRRFFSLRRFFQA